MVATIMLKGLDGFTLAESIRQEARLSLVPILLVEYCPNTARIEDWEAEWRTRLEASLGLYEMMNAPFKPDELVRRVQALWAWAARGQGGER